MAVATPMLVMPVCVGFSPHVLEGMCIMLTQIVGPFVAVMLALVAVEPIKVELKDFKCTTVDGKDTEAVGFNEGDSKIFFYTHGIAKADFKAPEEGDYTLVFEASCDEAMKTLAKIKIMQGEKELKKEFELTSSEMKAYKIDVKLKKGDNKISFEFLNDLYKEGEYDLNLYLHSVKFEEKKK
jgi:hypothetical protein